MRAMMPWKGMDVLRNEMDRVFERFLEPRWFEFEPAGEWAPTVDMAETKDAGLVQAEIPRVDQDAVVGKAEIPGVDRNGIGVTLQDQVLTIKGEKHREKEDKDEKYHRVERTWGAFTRSLRMPVAVASDKVTATFKDGTLTIMLPK